MMLDRIGTAAVTSSAVLVWEVAMGSGLVYVMGVLPSYNYCLLFCFSVFATENFYLTNFMSEKGLKYNKVVFLQLKSLFLNTMLIILS